MQNVWSKAFFKRRQTLSEICVLTWKNFSSSNYCCVKSGKISVVFNAKQVYFFVFSKVNNCFVWKFVDHGNSISKSYCKFKIFAFACFFHFFFQNFFNFFFISVKKLHCFSNKNFIVFFGNKPATRSAAKPKRMVKARASLLFHWKRFVAISKREGRANCFKKFIGIKFSKVWPKIFCTVAFNFSNNRKFWEIIVRVNFNIWILFPVL